MANVYLGSDLRDVMKLKGLISESASLPNEHPLVAGFAAAEQELRANRKPTIRDRQALTELKLFARTIFQLEDDWSPYTSRLVNDLVNSHECRSLLFELYVITFAIQGRVQQVNWVRYSEATPDISTKGPEMLVECTLHRSDKLFRVQSSLEAKRRQHPVLTVPYVIAVGFQHEFTSPEIKRVELVAQELRQWFRSNEGVSAGLIFTPAVPSGQQCEAYGFPAIQAFHGSCTQIINSGALYPLPPGFSFEG